jgi:outer membrane protein, heavy metal efflux system
MKFRIFIILMIAVYPVFAQNSINSILSAIEQNNLSLKANTRYWQARNIEYRSGVTPYDPEVAFDYMYGSPVGAGNQRDFVATQRFDFPTAYTKKRQLSNVQRSQSDWQMAAYRIDILLEAKKTAIELIYENKRQVILRNRLANITRLGSDYQKKMDAGDATILDVNKARLQLLSIQNELKQNEINVENLLAKLAELNGGTPVSLNDTTYPEMPIIPEFDVLLDQIEQADPIVKVYQYNEQVSKQKIGLQKALSLPKPEVGYHSQGILGQSYKGFHVGTSIPLWENKNKVKTEKANLAYTQLQTEQYKTEHKTEIERLYKKYVGTKKILDEYEATLSTLKSDYLLNKSLELGQISTVEYFLELSYYYKADDDYLQIEHEYYLLNAALNKYEL